MSYAFFEKDIIKYIVDDMRKKYGRATIRKEGIAEYRHFYAIFNKAVNLYREKYTKKDLRIYLSVPYTDATGNPIDKEECITTFCKTKGDLLAI